MTSAIFIDLDGTLLNNEQEITPWTKSILQFAQQKGYEIFLVTGKSFAAAQRYYEYLELNTPIITSQGQVILQPNNSNFESIVESTPIGNLLDIINFPELKSILLNWIIETLSTIWKYSQHSCESLTLISESYKPVQNLTLELLDTIESEKIIAIYLDVVKINESEMISLVKKLNETYFDLDFQYWYTEYRFTTITIKPRNCNKWLAIEKLRKSYKFDEVITFGNGWSDKEMLANSDLGIAMKNSLPKVQQLAKRVSQFDNDKDGVAQEILRIIGEKENGW